MDDFVGNRRTLTDRVGLHQFGYDALNRLAGADHPLAGGLVDETFTYDPVGNRTSSHFSLSHRYDAANRLLEDDSFLYTYDANGNLTTKTDKTTSAVTTYTYDIENQLTGIDLPGGAVAAYRYDGLGRRIEKNVNGQIQRYLYDQEDIVALFTGPSNCQTHVLLHGPGIDQPLAFLKDTNANCNPFSDAVGFREPIVDLLADGLGSIVALTSETGGFFRAVFLAERYTYDSFGTPTITGPGPDGQMDTGDDVTLTASTLGNPYAFTGREYDPESGLYYYQTRYYDPRTGRFLQEDRLRGVNHQDLNYYAYVRNNPNSFLDPLGLQPQPVLSLIPANNPPPTTIEQATRQGGRNRILGFIFGLGLLLTGQKDPRKRRPDDPRTPKKTEQIYDPKKDPNRPQIECPGGGQFRSP